jgi:hypothetical protein
MRWLGLSVSLSLLGCGDPEGPGAAGTLSLDPGIRAADYAVLEIRAYPNTGSEFDPALIPAEPPARLGTFLSEVTFPHAYSVSEGPNTSDVAGWRLVAWLSRELGSPARPAADEPFCTTVFALASCGSFGGFCKITSGVDCTIE